MAKLISLLQPWASLAAMGLKTVETRSWSTAYRGPLLLHAGQRRSGKAVWQASALLRQLIPDFDGLPFGALVGEVQLVAVERLAALDIAPEELRRRSLEERGFSEAPQRFAWIFAAAVLLDDPIPARGRLGLWDL